jgi:hypothetical protein
MSFLIQCVWRLATWNWNNPIIVTINLNFYFVFLQMESGVFLEDAVKAECESRYCSAAVTPSETASLDFGSVGVESLDDGV